MQPLETTVYLIHFERAFWHAQHYIGYTANLDQRVEQHRKGTGAKLLRAINTRGIPWQVVRTWPGGHALERALKNRKNSRNLCPVCMQQRLIERWHIQPLSQPSPSPLWEVPL
jgi:predicted GIY-YIG superfamily endonuclease